MNDRDRRAARRKRILENAEDRLKRVVATKASARKSKETDDEADVASKAFRDLEDDDEISNEASGLKIEKEIDRIKEAGRELGIESEVKDDATEKENKNEVLNSHNISEETKQSGESLNRYMETHQTNHPQHTASRDKPPISSTDESKSEEEKDLNDRKLYRLILVMSLGVLLVAINSVNFFAQYRATIMKDASFFPYFFILEVINFMLFPIGKQTKMPQMLLLALRLSGVPQGTIDKLLYFIQCCSRLIEDFAVFLFTVMLWNNVVFKLVKKKA